MNASFTDCSSCGVPAAPAVDYGSRNVLLLLRHDKVYLFPLGVHDHNTLALTPTELGFPTPESFVKQTRDLGLPEMLGFVTACLGVLLAVYLIKSWKQ
jgi:hypothetical protein